MTLIAADYAAKGLLIFMTCSFVATGLAHSKLITRTDQMLTRRAMFRHSQHIRRSLINIISSHTHFEKFITVGAFVFKL